MVISDDNFGLALLANHVQGKFEVKADVYTKDEKLVTCLETAITFS